MWTAALTLEQLLSPQQQALFVVAATFFEAAVLWHYWSSGFYYASFRDGPWGNFGMVVGLLVILLHTRATTRSGRLARQLKVLIPSLFASLFLGLGAWGAEVVWAVPNAMFLTGVPMLAAGTVKRHCHNIIEKAGATNRSDLLGKLLQNQPVPPPNPS